MSVDSGRDHGEMSTAPPASAAAADAAAPQAPTNPLLDFSGTELLAAYQRRDFADMSRLFLAVLNHLKDVTYEHLDPATAQALNSFTKHFLYFMTQEDFEPSDADLAAFIARNAVIANLAAISEFGTTDPFVRILLGQSRNFTKLLALYSPRNRIHIDPRVIFNTNPTLATKWYFSCLENYRSDCADKGTLEKLRQHIRYEDDRMVGELGATHHTYFGATYIDHEHDYLVKQRINRLFQMTPLCTRTVVNRPKPRRIAIVTSMWWPQQSVYRSQQPFIKALARDHELVLVHLGKDRSDLDTAGFAEVRRYDASANTGDLSAVDPNDFAMAYFPDIGMSIESVILANMRIAPIQVSNYGHPVSTFGAKIDYWIGGRETEAADRAREHYSERLVLIPGCGQAPVPITHKPSYPSLPASPVVIDCSWAGQKINDDHLQRLAEIVRRARTPVRFKFFPGGSILENRLIPLRKSIAEVLGAERGHQLRDLHDAARGGPLRPRCPSLRGLQHGRRPAHDAKARRHARGQPVLQPLDGLPAPPGGARGADRRHARAVHRPGRADDRRRGLPRPDDPAAQDRRPRDDRAQPRARALVRAGDRPPSRAPRRALPAAGPRAAVHRVAA